MPLSKRSNTSQRLAGLINVKRRGGAQSQPLSRHRYGRGDNRAAHRTGFRTCAELDLFDADNGYLQTTLADADRMSLRFFVEYNNVWWFAIIDGVDVPSIAYDPETDTGAIVLDIRYGDDHLLAMQHIQFGGDRITRLQTYASNTFFGRDKPLIRLDAYGNAIWLETGYDLKISAEAAEVFLRTPNGLRFAEREPTRTAIIRIKGNLADLRKRYGWSPI